jgi:hypothetical protein
VRTKKVSSRTANAIVNPSWRDWLELPAIASTVNVPPRISPAEVMVPPVSATARTNDSGSGWSRDSSRTRVISRML